MNSEELHVYEEETNLFWGLLVIFTTATATYILANAFITSGWKLSGFKQLLVLLLFAISFIGIFKISDPLLHFIFSVKKGSLHIVVMKGEQNIKTIEIPLREIEGLKFAPHYPRGKDEAAFDFSTTYHLMWKSKSKNSYHKLLDLESFTFTLKVEDITKIIRFVRRYNPEIRVPEQQSDFFGL